MTTTSPATSTTMPSDASPLPRALPTSIQHYIDGSRVDSVAGTTIPVTDPVSHREYAVLAAGAPADVDLAVTAARRAFEESGWAQMPSRRRSDVLRKIADAIESRAAVISAFEAFDTGQPVSQARGLAARAAENFRYFADVCSAMHEDAFRTNAQLGYVIRRPRGVAGLITEMVLAGDAAELPKLLPDAMTAALSPYIGRQATAEYVRPITNRR